MRHSHCFIHFRRLALRVDLSRSIDGHRRERARSLQLGCTLSARTAVPAFVFCSTRSRLHHTIILDNL